MTATPSHATHPSTLHLASADATRLARALYGIDAQATALDGEFDENFLLSVDGQPTAVLKVSHPAERLPLIDLQRRAFEHLAVHAPELTLPRLIPLTSGKPVDVIPDGLPGAGRFVRLLSYIPGGLLVDTAPYTPASLESVGVLAATVDRALLGFEHSATHRGLHIGDGDGPGGGFRWYMADALWIRDVLDAVADPRQRGLVTTVLDTFERDVLPLLPALRQSVIHGDPNDYNILVADGQAVAFIDFGDLHRTALVCELAVCAAYVMLGANDPLGAAAHVIRGYERVLPLTMSERMLLLPLILTRLAVSVTNAAARRVQEPDKAYLSVSEAPAWRVLEQLVGVPAEMAQGVLFTTALTPVSATETEELLARRRRTIGPNLGLSYQSSPSGPLHIVRGWKQYLYDARGREYLDAYNNVAHVGHSHPHVVAAIARQSALLNTNTRYLHESLVTYAVRLTALFPAPLSVCYFVNSASEANELALRLARAHTGVEDDIIVSDSAYHGNTQGLINVSPYKYNGAGGTGRPPYVSAVPVPDVYRGAYSGPDAGVRYAAHVQEVVDTLRAEGRRVRAVLIESLLSCGGQIVPSGWLSHARIRGGASSGRCLHRGRSAGRVRARRITLVGIRASGRRSRHRGVREADRQRAPGRRGRDHARDRRELRQRHGVFQHLRRQSGEHGGRTSGA